MQTILDESQEQRDREISRYTGVSVARIREHDIASRPLGPIMYTGGDFSAKSYDQLYKRLRHAELEEAFRLFGAFIVVKRGELVRRGVELAGNIKGKRVLDYGCGIGSHGIYCLQKGAKTDFLDVNGPIYRFGRWRVRDRGLSGSASFLYPNAKLEKHRYHFILCVDVMEHLADPYTKFMRLLRALKPGGTMVLQVGTKASPRQGHFKQSIAIWTSRKCQNLVAKNLKKLEQYVYKKGG